MYVTVVILLVFCCIDAKLVGGTQSLQRPWRRRSPSCFESLRSLLSLRGGKLNAKDKRKKRTNVISRFAKKKMTGEEVMKVIQWQKGVMQVHNAVISMASMYLSRKIMKVDYKNPDVLKRVRMVFVSYLIFAQLLYFVLKYLIKRENNHMEFVTPPESPVSSIPSLAGNPLVKMIEGFGKKTSAAPISVRQYDLQQNRELFGSLVNEIIGVAILHMVFKMGTPLLMVPMWGLTNRLKAPLVLIRIFGMKPLGQFARPFKSSMEMMMSDMMSGLTASVGIENQGEENLEFGGDSVYDGEKLINELKENAKGIISEEKIGNNQVAVSDLRKEHQIRDDQEVSRSALEKEQIASMFADDHFDPLDDMVEENSEQSSSSPKESTVSPLKKTAISSTSSYPSSETVSLKSLKSLPVLPDNDSNSIPTAASGVSASQVPKLAEHKRKAATEETARKFKESMKSFLDEFDNHFQQSASENNNNEETKWW